MNDRAICLSMIVAAARNGTIGRDNALPWRLADDLRYFRRVTMGKPVVMGRRTFDSVGRPLPGRDNIVVSRSPVFGPPGVRVAHSIDNAMALAERSAQDSEADEVMLLGGAQLYAAVLPRVQRIYLTRVHADVIGDAVLPPLAPEQWRQVACEDHPAGTDNEYPFSFIVLERR